MKTLITWCALTLASAILARPATLRGDDKFSSTVTLASNYIYRAMSYNSQGAPYAAQGSPVLEASLDYTHDWSGAANVGASFFTGPCDTFNTQTFVMEKDVEGDVFLSGNITPAKNLSLGVGYNYYSFEKNVDNAMGEYAVMASYKNLSFISSYVDAFSGLATNYNHNMLTWRPMFNDKTGLDLHLAHSFFNNPAAVATSSYYDYLAGLTFAEDGFNVEIAYSNSFNRTNLINGQYAKTDGTFTVSLNRTFNIYQKAK